MCWQTVKLVFRLFLVEKFKKPIRLFPLLANDAQQGMIEYTESESSAFRRQTTGGVEHDRCWSGSTGIYRHSTTFYQNRARPTFY
jgi:hypothetical protein